MHDGHNIWVPVQLGVNLDLVRDRTRIGAGIWTRGEPVDESQMLRYDECFRELELLLDQRPLGGISA